MTTVLVMVVVAANTYVYKLISIVFKSQRILSQKWFHLYIKLFMLLAFVPSSIVLCTHYMTGVCRQCMSNTKKTLSYNDDAVYKNRTPKPKC